MTHPWPRATTMGGCGALGEVIVIHGNTIGVEVGLQVPIHNGQLNPKWRSFCSSFYCECTLHVLTSCSDSRESFRHGDHVAFFALNLKRMIWEPLRVGCIPSHNSTNALSYLRSSRKVPKERKLHPCICSRRALGKKIASRVCSLDIKLSKSPEPQLLSESVF